MAVSKKIHATFEVSGMHSWPEAPDKVGFLRNPHRHLFKFQVTIPVTGDDREVEFLCLSSDARSYIVRYKFCDNLGTVDFESKSCEMLAEYVAQSVIREYQVPWCEVSVFEDGENGATVKVEKE